MSTNYSVTIDPNAEVSKWVTKLASKKRAEFDEAMEAVAAFIGEVVLSVVEAVPVVGNLYSTISYNKGTAPSLPLDVYYDVRDRNYIQVWTQAIAGGMATNQVHGLNELMVSTFWLNSAISMLKEYAENGRLDVLAASIERMAQEILVKQESISATVISTALGQARYTNIAGASVPQGIRATTAGTFQMHDLNRLITLLQRIRPSWVGSTPTAGNVLTHLVGSPEFHEDLRSIAYQPQNTRAVPNTDESTVLAGPDAVRNQVFNAAGNPTFFGIELLNVYNLGVGQEYNTLFADAIGSTAVDGGAAFAPTTEEVVWGLALRSNNKALVRLVERDGGGSTLQVSPDDSFPMRSEKLGFVSKIKEGRVITDHRNLCFAVL